MIKVDKLHKLLCCIYLEPSKSIVIVPYIKKKIIVGKYFFSCLALIFADELNNKTDTKPKSKLSPGGKNTAALKKKMSLQT